MNNNLLIVGAGQYGFVAKEIAECIGVYNKIDFVDDINPIAIGKICELDKLKTNYNYAVVAIGNSKVRLEIIYKLKEFGYKVPVLKHPLAYVAPSSKLSDGCIIEPMAVVQANSAIGTGCLVSSCSVINHNCNIGDACHIDCNATVGSNVVLVAGCKIPYGEVVTVDNNKYNL